MVLLGRNPSFWSSFESYVSFYSKVKKEVQDKMFHKEFGLAAAIDSSWLFRMNNYETKLAIYYFYILIKCLDFWDFTHCYHAERWGRYPHFYVNNELPLSLIYNLRQSE